MGLSFSDWAARALLALPSKQGTKHDAPRPLSTSTTTITGPDRNCRHRITSAMPWPSRRAAGGLRRPSESRALLAFLRLSLPGRLGRPQHNDLSRCVTPMQWRTEDPKTSAQTAGIRGIVPSTPRRRRRIPSISSCSRNKFGRESVVFPSVGGLPRKKKAPYVFHLLAYERGGKERRRETHAGRGQSLQRPSPITLSCCGVVALRRLSA